MTAGRSRFDEYLAGESSSEAAVVLLAEQLSARLGKMSFSAMQDDATHWVANQASLRSLLPVDAVVIGADITVTAEACGAAVNWDEDTPVLSGSRSDETTTINFTSRQGTALDAINRLTQIARRDTGCIACLTGPVTLSEQLFPGDEQGLSKAKELCVALIEKMSECRPDLLLLREGPALGQRALGMPERKAYSTIKNMVSYFDVPLGIYLEGYETDQLQQFSKLKLPHLWLGADARGELVDIQSLAEIAEDYEGLGIPVNFSDPDSARDRVNRSRETLSGSNYLFTSSGDLKRDEALDSLIELVAQIHG